MRISSSQIYDSGIRGMQHAQNAVYKTQSQISADRRILTPSDDPVASAQALVVAQSKAVNEQYQTNQGSAQSLLRLVDSNLSSVTSVLQSIRDSIVQAGNTGTMTNSDRATIATQIESDLSELLGLANTDNGVGEYLYSGYQGATKPFAVDATQSAISPATTSPVKYYGDEGSRSLQVSASRQIAVTASGSDVFMAGKNGNGTFVTRTGGNGSGNNQGSALIDSGSVLDPQTWSAAVNNTGPTGAGQPLEIRFSTNATTGKMEYSIYDPVGLSTTPETYIPGQAISLVTKNGVDFGSQVTVSGTPTAGDTFKISPSTSQSVFQTAQNLIGILRSPVGSTIYTATQLANDLAGQLTTIDQQLQNVSRVQSNIGASMKEVDSLASTSSDLAIQYTATISDLQDLDYVAAYSAYTQQQITLEAAQKSFTAISGLSLFKYI